MQLELTDRSSPERVVPESSVAPHGTAKQGGLAGFFSSIVHEEEGEKVLNPPSGDSSYPPLVIAPTPFW